MVLMIESIYIITGNAVGLLLGAAQGQNIKYFCIGCGFLHWYNFV